MADLPGLIEGAHKGVGLGTRFLRHIERTRLLAHLIDTSDASQRDPVRDYEIIQGELESFSPALVAKPMIVVATKLDMTTDRARLDELARSARNADSNFILSLRPQVKESGVGVRDGGCVRPYTAASPWDL